MTQERITGKDAHESFNIVKLAAHEAYNIVKQAGTSLNR